MNQKIKLVAFDMDGTVLNSKNELPKGLFKLIENHSEIQFVVASGRQYFSLLKIFEPIKDKLIFISENGGIIMKAGEKLHISPIKENHVRDILQRIENVKDVYVVLGCEKTSYIQNPPKYVIDDVEQYNERLEIVDNIKDVVGKDNVLNLALYSKNRAKENILPKLSDISNELCAVLSAKSWVDVINADVNKGSAIKIVQKLYGIKPEECVAFGDYMNDYELLQSCGESYAMANAHEEIKKISKHIAPSNDDDGVMKILLDIL